MLSPDLVEEITGAPWFVVTGQPYLIVDPELRIRGANQAYELACGYPESVMVGEHLFEVFPDNPADPCADGVANLAASLDSVFVDRERHWMGIQRYDIPDPWNREQFVHRVWATVNTPIRVDGRVVAALHNVRDVTVVFSSGENGISLDAVSEAAHRLVGKFPELTYPAVLGIVAHSHRVVIDTLGEVNTERAIALATMRLEVLAGHPAPPE